MRGMPFDHSPHGEEPEQVPLGKPDNELPSREEIADLRFLAARDLEEQDVIACLQISGDGDLQEPEYDSRAGAAARCPHVMRRHTQDESAADQDERCAEEQPESRFEDFPGVREDLTRSDFSVDARRTLAEDFAAGRATVLGLVDCFAAGGAGCRIDGLTSGVVLPPVAGERLLKRSRSRRAREVPLVLVGRLGWVGDGQ